MYIKFEFDLFRKKHNSDRYLYTSDDALYKALEYLDKVRTPDKPFASVEEVIKTARTFENYMKEGKKDNG